MTLTADHIRQTAERLDLIVTPGKRSKLTVEFVGREDFNKLLQVIGYRAAVQMDKNEQRHGKRQQ